MKINFKNIGLLLLLAVMFSCSKKNENYKDLIKDGEVYYPGVIANTNYRAGNLRAMLVWNPSPDPKIVKYKIYWNNKQDSLTVPAETHSPLDTVKVLVPGLKEGTYNFNVYSIDNSNRVSIAMNINGVRVYGPVYLSGIFNRGYNADTPYVVNLNAGSVKLKFNTPDSINLQTIVRYTDNTGKVNAVILRPDSSAITLPNFKFGTDVTYQSSYIPTKGAIDIFEVANVSTFPVIRRIGDITSFYIKNPGAPFQRGDSGTDKWGTPKDWLFNSNVLNQNGGRGGGWSWDSNGVIHFETMDWGGANLENGKIYQTFTLPEGKYAMDFTVQGYGGNFKVNLLAVAGTTLPDINNIGNTLGRFEGDQNSLGGGTRTITFTLTQATTVAVGWVVSTGQYTYLQFKSVKLRSVE